jgi:serine/threonine protein kinase
MEYLEGGQLKSVLDFRVKAATNKESEPNQDGPISESISELEPVKGLNLKSPLFSEEEVSRIIKNVLHGLEPVHDNNYIHRDIKPENIILAPLPSGNYSDHSPQK